MESIQIEGESKEEKYRSLVPQLQALWEGEEDLVANMANTCAALMQVFRFHWVGFYLVKSDFLVLGPFQGLVACTRIRFGKGVCGTSWAMQKTLVVDDVDAFPGHIACSALSKSEIVVPVFGQGNISDESQVIAVLDVDSEHYRHFDQTDKTWLEKICKLLIRAK